MMRVTIDRFEGDYAVCEMEDRTMINIEKSKIPHKAKEGDILIIENNVINVDSKGTDHRKQKIKDLMEDLWE